MKQIFVLLLIVLFASCGHGFPDSITGNGKVQERIVNTDTILYLNVASRLEAVLIPSDSLKIVIEADENLQEYIYAEQHYGELKIYSDKYIRMAKSKRVYIYSNSIVSIEISSGASFENADSLTIRDFMVGGSSGAEIAVKGTFNRLDVRGSSGCDIDLQGSCEQLHVNLSSAADLRAFELQARKANIVTSSAADARINVSEEAHFNASSASDIIYRGEPEIITSQASSAADIKKSGRY
jgi:hypothetical protein